MGITIVHMARCGMGDQCFVPNVVVRYFDRFPLICKDM